MSKPVIGITSYVEPASWGAWTNVTAALVPAAYVDHVRRGWRHPVVVPPLGRCGDADGRADLLRRLDGLILAGGADVESSRYGQEPHELAQEPRRDRDGGELLLATAARGVLPVLGVCRGMQVMVVAAGGQLEQHLPDRLGHLDHGPAPGTYGVAHGRDHAGQSAAIAGRRPRSRSTATTTRACGPIPTYDAAAYSTDGVVEAIEAAESGFHLGVQWHPETGVDGRLFEALVKAATTAAN